MKTKKYTWEELIKDCNILAEEIQSLNIDFYCIVGISRGGLIPATILSHLLDIKKIYSIGYYSYNMKRRGKLIKMTETPKDIIMSNVLLVDDIIDSGNTMNAAKKELERYKNQVMTVSLHYNSSAKYSEIKTGFVPHIYRHKIKNWIQYPWEINKNI